MSGPTDWILRYIKTTFFLPTYPFLTRPSDCNQIWQAFVDWSGNDSNLNNWPISPQGRFKGVTIQKSGLLCCCCRSSYTCVCVCVCVCVRACVRTCVCLSVCVSICLYLCISVCMSVKKSVKRLERSNGLDTALYKNYLFFTHLPFFDTTVGLQPNLAGICGLIWKWFEPEQLTHLTPGEI